MIILDNYRCLSELIFGGVNGFNLFDPSETVTYDSPPEVVVTSVRRFHGDSVETLQIPAEGPLQLSYEDDFVAFDEEPGGLEPDDQVLGRRGLGGCVADLRGLGLDRRQDVVLGLRSDQLERVVTHECEGIGAL